MKPTVSINNVSCTLSEKHFAFAAHTQDLDTESNNKPVKSYKHSNSLG